jgi:hypothetical protein
MDRRLIALAFAAAAVCLGFLARFYEVGDGACFHADYVYVLPSACEGRIPALWLEIAATLLSAVAVGVWITKKPNVPH